MCLTTKSFNTKSNVICLGYLWHKEKKEQGTIELMRNFIKKLYYTLPLRGLMSKLEVISSAPVQGLLCSSLSSNWNILAESLGDSHMDPWAGMERVHPVRFVPGHHIATHLPSSELSQANICHQPNRLQLLRLDSDLEMPPGSCIATWHSKSPQFWSLRITTASGKVSTCI